MRMNKNLERKVGFFKTNAHCVRSYAIQCIITNVECTYFTSIYAHSGHHWNKKLWPSFG